MARFQKINEACSNKSLNAMKNIDLASLPPCKKTLEKHIERVIYTVGILKHSHLPNPMIPNPENCGWEKVNGVLQSHWFDDKEMPLQLEDVKVRDESDSDMDSDAESDIMSDSDED